MNKTKIVSIVIAFFCIGAALAQAQFYWYLPPGAGPYFRMGVGPTIYQDGQIRGFVGSTPAVDGPREPVNYDTGVAVDGALGFAFDQYFGIDFETGYVWARINNIPNYNSNGSTIGNVPLLVNATLSLPIPHTNIVPYIGGGAGGAISTFDAHAFNYQGSAIPADTDYGSQSDAVFAYQAFAGVRFMLAPNVSVGLGYKYFATGNPTYSYPPSPNLNAEFEGVRSHSILFTLQCDF